MLMRLVAAGVLAAAASAPAHAHHGWGSYDASEIVTLEGVLTAVTYEFPHVMASIAVDGQEYMIVLAPPSRMGNRGLPEERLRVGDTATVVGYIHKGDPEELRAERIVIAGETTELR